MSIFKSFRHAFSGISFCATHERNMRIHIVMTIYVAYFSQFYELTRSEIILLTMTCMLVMAFEMLNTSIEVVIDKVSPEYSALAKVGKDIAAGAVLLSAIMAVIVGAVLFWDIERFKIIWDYFTGNLTSLVLLVGFTLIAIIFIRSGKKRNTSKIKGQKNEHQK